MISSLTKYFEVDEAIDEYIKNFGSNYDLDTDSETDFEKLFTTHKYLIVDENS